MPVGLEDVSTYPDLFAELIRRGWSEVDLEKLAANNLLRVFREVEKVRKLEKVIQVQSFSIQSL